MPRKPAIDPLLFTIFETKPSKGEQKRAEIVQTALKILTDDGIEAVGFESIAKQMGTRRSHIAYYFKDTAEIISAVYRYIYSKRNKTVSAALDETRDFEEALERYLSSQFDWFGEEVVFLKGKTFFYHYATRVEAYRKLQAEVLAYGRKRIEGVLKLSPKHEKLSPKALTELAEAIQNSVGGQLIFTVTTTVLSDEALKKAKEAARRSLKKLLS